MRVLAILICMLTASLNAVHAADEDDRAAVRKESERYAAFILKGNKAELEKLLHKNYQGQIGIQGQLDKSEMVKYWLDRNFSRFEVEVDGVRQFGDTAIETGTLSALTGRNDTWSELRYTRVWVREGKGWRLVHEHF